MPGGGGVMESTTTVEFCELVRACGLTRREVAALIHCTERALATWMLPAGSKGHREPPAMVLELLRIKLAAL